ncbi:tyrosine-type recombinase/integrase [Flavobacterium soyae]|uniref:tyrosine-type recombinase/integrase n=1 Tax=Flavobacterium soyae TaxID=2903098 RepID=UPI001E4E6BCC|nr:tyrosine-type recombinase/integrase [Flavobacterium soyae]MCD9574173.1 tyrosine-type recombinase/integrase [Flavobacterium soyae]
MLANMIYDFRKELQTLGYCRKVINTYPKYAQKLLEYTRETPQRITDTHIKNYYGHLQTQPSRATKKVISQSHLYSQLLAIKLYFDYLERIKSIKRNPYNLKIKHAAKTERKIFTQKEIKLLYKSCQNNIERAILHLCYSCGLRQNEAELLNIKDVNLEQKLLFVRKGKGKKRRVIPFTETIAKDLKDFLKDIEIIRKENQESFLINTNGYRMKGLNIYNLFKRLIGRTQNLKPENYCLHSLRHSIATHLLENEMSIEMVRDFLGHSQLSTTQIYTRTSNLKLKQ